jgi:signal transduction histidine kinase
MGNVIFQLKKFFEFTNNCLPDKKVELFKYWHLLLIMFCFSLGSFLYFHNNYVFSRTLAARATGIALGLPKIAGDIESLDGDDLVVFLDDYISSVELVSHDMQLGKVIPFGVFDLYIPNKNKTTCAHIRLVADGTEGLLDKSPSLEIVPGYAKYDDGLKGYLVLRYTWSNYAFNVLLPFLVVFLCIVVVGVSYILKDLYMKQKDIQLMQFEQFRDIAGVSSGIAHNMRNYLSVIKLNTQLLQHTLKTQCEIDHGMKIMFNKQYGMVAKNIELATAMTTDLLDFAKQTTELNDQIEIPMFDILTLVSEMFLESLEVESNILVHVESNTTRTVYCIGNENYVINVFMNMFKNAAEAFENEEKRDKNINAHLSIAGNICKIEFIDNGCGMPQNVLTRIKEPFFTTGKRMGTGLGVASADRIIKNMNGSLHFESEEGEGTSAIIQIPINRLE